jgi:hypothetical protein
MLKEDMDKNKQKRTDTNTAYFGVPWSNTAIRFNEELQLIDSLDCFNVVYGSEGSSKTAQTKYLSGSGLEELSTALKCKPKDIIYKAKWQDSSRVRTVLMVPHMQFLLSKFVTSMPNASKLAKILDVPCLNIRSVNSIVVSDKSSTVPSDVVGDQVDYVAPSAEALSISKHDAFKYANSAIVAQTATRWMIASGVEADARALTAKAEAEESAKLAEYNTLKQKCMDDVDYKEKQVSAKHRIDAVECEKNERNKRARIDTLCHKISALERMGMSEEASKLKLELVDI